MSVNRWLWLGALAGLIGGIILEALTDLPTTPMRVTQLVMILFGAAVSAFVYEGSKMAAGGHEPSESTDPAPRRFLRWRRARLAPAPSQPPAPRR